MFGALLRGLLARPAILTVQLGEVVSTHACMHLMSKQKETYNNLIAKGVPLRMVKVEIVSFDDKEYLVVDRKFERFV